MDWASVRGKRLNTDTLFSIYTHRKEEIELLELEIKIHLIVSHEMKKCKKLHEPVTYGRWIKH